MTICAQVPGRCEKTAVGGHRTANSLRFRMQPASPGTMARASRNRREQECRWLRSSRRRGWRGTRRGRWPTGCARRRSPRWSARTICSAPTARSPGCSTSGSLGSLIFWGPPGTGKTTVARLLAARDRSPFRADLGGLLRRRRPQEGLRGGARPARGGRGDASLRRRDPPLQPRPAGLLPAGDGGRHRHAGRRHDREPVLRAQRRASLARPRARLQAARRGGARRSSSPAPRRSRAGSCRSTTMRAPC